LTGCADGARLVVPAELIGSTVAEDLRESFDLYGARGVSLEAGAAGAAAFLFCDGSEGSCRDLVFSRTGTEAAVVDAVDLLSRRDDVRRVVVVLSPEWAEIHGVESDGGEGELPALADGARGNRRDGNPPPVQVLLSDPGEPADSFARRVDSTVRSPGVGTVLLAGDETPAVLRRWGVPSEAGPIVFEAPFPGTGARFREAGYSVPATISYDLTAFLNADDGSRREGASVYVPTVLFRY